MQISFTEKKNIRKSFGKLKESLSIPNLIEVQKNSYKELTDFDVNAELDRPIPTEHFAAVAEIISYVLRLARGR